jgi:hypothetical protein
MALESCMRVFNHYVHPPVLLLFATEFCICIAALYVAVMGVTGVFSAGGVLGGHASMLHAGLFAAVGGAAARADDGDGQAIVIAQLATNPQCARCLVNRRKQRRVVIITIEDHAHVGIAHGAAFFIDIGRIQGIA